MACTRASGATPPIWKALASVPKRRAVDVAAVFEITPAPLAQSVSIANDPFQKNATIEALYAEKPDGKLLSRICGYKIRVSALRDRNWIRKSQRVLAPVRAGRFFIYGAHDKGKIPRGRIPICIEAGMAFGTGHHETTSLCLKALSELACKKHFRHALDLGCGTGVLAIAAAKLWCEPVTASDIDPEAVAVATENALANGEGQRVQVVLANGFDDAALKGRARFDLVVANILSKPLMKLATPMASALAPRGMAVLSGLMRDEEETILSAYRRRGMKRVGVMRDGPWSALVLRKPPRKR